ncbi:MAG: CpsD/CapB family tyrosine-protein kinase [Rubrivivax sp.]
MSIIEQAARRLDALQRAGIAVPWEAAGTQAREVVAQLRQEAPVRPAGLADGGATLRQLTLDLPYLEAQGFLVPGLEGSALADDFRRAKRALLEQLRNAGRSRQAGGAVIVVTSPTEGPGRARVAINLALSMSMEVDTSVLLVEADTRAPSLLTRLGGEAGPGLVDLLMDPGLGLPRAVLQTSLPALSLLPAGTPSDRSHELYASPGMRSLLAQLAGAGPGRVVIVDAPPLLRGTDARTLAAMASQVVVVVEALRTPRATVRAAFDELQGCPAVVSLLDHAASGVPA